MYCQQCAAQNPDSTNFCRVCGASMRQLQQPATDLFTDGPRDRTRERESVREKVLSWLGIFFVLLGLAIFALFVAVVLITSSVGLIELIVALFGCFLFISLGLLLRYWSRAGGERNLVLPFAADTAELSERHRNSSLSPRASSVAPVSSVTEATTELLDVKKQ